MMKSLIAGIGAGGLAIGTPLCAAPIIPVSYDMPNGGGQASGGTFNYWDASYDGAGTVTSDGASLTGGSGDLTDGIVAGATWSLVENPAGTGPYVGWLFGAQTNPLINFFFSGSPTINSISLHVDNTANTVLAPASILVDGVPQVYTPPPLFSIGTITLSGLNLTGNQHSIQLFQVPGNWVFVSEISFDGAAGAVPEPATWAMMILGFGLVGGAMRYRRRATRVAFATA